MLPFNISRKMDFKNEELLVAMIEQTFENTSCNTSHMREEDVEVKQVWYANSIAQTVWYSVVHTCPSIGRQTCTCELYLMIIPKLQKPSKHA